MDAWNSQGADSRAGEHYEIRYEPLSGRGPGLAFPCDARGRVPLDALSERARHNYLYARVVVGREYASPVVLRCAGH